MKRLILKLSLLLLFVGSSGFAVANPARHCPIGEIPCGQNLSQCCIL
jgi:hypothetical protein